LENALDKVDNCTPSEMKAINNACTEAFETKNDK